MCRRSCKRCDVAGLESRDGLIASRHFLPQLTDPPTLLTHKLLQAADLVVPYPVLLHLPLQLIYLATLLFCCPARQLKISPRRL